MYAVHPMSIIITINERDVSVLQTVFKSVRVQLEAHDEFIIVLDRTPAPLAEYVKNYWHGNAQVVVVERDGPPGWRSPVKAWNAGFERVSKPFIYAFSSETTQNDGNFERARTLLVNNPRVLLFGKTECTCGPYGTEVNWNGTAPGNLLCDSDHPRPLGFIWAGPTDAIKAVGGYDENFYEGYWFDDNDFYARLWNDGLDFAFDDSIAGNHIHHERPDIGTINGQMGIERNRLYMMHKWGCLDPMANMAKKVEYDKGRTIWRHVA